MGFHIQMWSKVSYIKKLMEIAIDISELVLFAHGYNTSFQRVQNEKKQAGNDRAFVLVENCNLY